jgi:hypothetical protein
MREHAPLGVYVVLSVLEGSRTSKNRLAPCIDPRHGGFLVDAAGKAGSSWTSIAAQGAELMRIWKVFKKRMEIFASSLEQQGAPSEMVEKARGVAASMAGADRITGTQKVGRRLSLTQPPRPFVVVYGNERLVAMEPVGESQFAAVVFELDPSGTSVLMSSLSSTKKVGDRVFISVDVKDLALIDANGDVQKVVLTHAVNETFAANIGCALECVEEFLARVNEMN